MNGDSGSQQASMGTINNGWRIVKASGDYNGDGMDDVMWRHADSGEVFTWEMQGAMGFSANFIGGVSNAWKIVDASADYNADGRDDILWRSSDSGTVAVWQMKGQARSTRMCRAG